MAVDKGTRRAESGGWGTGGNYKPPSQSLIPRRERSSLERERTWMKKKMPNIAAHTALTHVDASIKIEQQELEPGDAVWLSLKTRKFQFELPLTSLTVDELRALREVIDFGFRLAQPVCVERDEFSVGGSDDGSDGDGDSGADDLIPDDEFGFEKVSPGKADDEDPHEGAGVKGVGVPISAWRAYRRFPQVLVAGGSSEEYAQSIPLGPAFDEEVGGFERRRLVAARRPRSGVAGRSSMRGSSPEDNLT